MKIYTNSIIKNASIINMMYDGKAENTSSICLNFTNGKAYVRNVDNSQVQMPFEFDENDLDIESLTMDSKKFLTICEFYQDDEDCLDVVATNEGYIFYHGSEEFRIAPVANDATFDPDVFNTGEPEDSFVVEEDFYKRLKIASTYENLSLKGIHLYNNQLFSANISSFYFKNLNQDIPDIVLSEDDVDFILQASVGSTVEVHDRFLRIDKPNGVSFIVANQDDIELAVEAFNEKFQRAYTHDNYIKLNYNDFLHFLNSLSPFTSEVEESVAEFFIDDDVLSVEVKSDTTSIKRNIKLSEVEGEFDFEIYFSISELVKNIKNLDKGEEVCIEMSDREFVNSQNQTVKARLCKIWSTDQENQYVAQKRLTT